MKGVMKLLFIHFCCSYYTTIQVFRIWSEGTAVRVNVLILTVAIVTAET